MVGTPFQFLEPNLTAKGDPVDNGADKGILVGACHKFSVVVKHAV